MGYKSGLKKLVEHCQELVENRDAIFAQKELAIAHHLEKQEAMQATIAKYQRMFYGQKIERFMYPDQQLAIPFEIEPEVLAVIEEAIVEKIEVTYTKEKKKHPGRLTLPDHLEVVETVIEHQNTPLEWHL